VSDVLGAGQQDPEDGFSKGINKGISLRFCSFDACPEQEQDVEQVHIKTEHPLSCIELYRRSATLLNSVIESNRQQVMIIWSILFAIKFKY
jgi:hypothetical protein